MFRPCLAFAFVLSLAASGFSQSAPAAADSTKAASRSLAADTAQSAGTASASDTMRPADSASASAAPVSDTTGPADSASIGAAAEPAAAQDSTASAAAPASEALDTAAAPAITAEPPSAPVVRETPDLRLFKDPNLIAREYGFGILGSVVAGALGFYIGSGIETAIQGESHAHKGTLKFTGIRYDNFKGAFWGGASGMLIGSALTTYFVGETDEEDGGLFMTLAGTAAAGAGAFYIAHLAGVNDDVDWKPFIPLLAIPSLGGTLGFNISRWFHDRKREATVERETSIRIHAPGLAWGRTEGGDRLEVRALNLTF